MPYDVTLGRLAFPTITDDVKEAVGDTLEAAGAVVVAGERRARSFQITLPVEAARDDDELVGERLRRQVRALLENADARLQGLYFRFVIDPDLNGWLLIGGGDLPYADGGPTFHRYELKLDDAYRVATLRTHRPARRLEVYDRRLATTPRDLRGALFSTDFAASSIVPALVLPPGATDVLVNGALATVLGVRQGLDGAAPVIAASIPAGAPALPSGSVVSFELAENDLGRGAVVILDRRGNTTPAGGFTLAGDQTEQQTYGWEEVYGPDQALTAADVPVLRNSFARLRWIPGVPAFALERWVAGTGFVERGRFYLYNVTDAARYNVLLDARVVEWTPERGVIRVVLANGVAGRREELFLTLERAWLGPRVEAYRSSSNAGSIELRWAPATAGQVKWWTPASPATVIDSAAAWNQAAIAFARPASALQTVSDRVTVALAAVDDSVTLQPRIDAVAYGANRNALAAAPAAGGAYLSVHLAPAAATNDFAGETGTRRAAGQALDGVVDLAETVALVDARALPELVAR